ncbi:inactive ribonuclease-like protein 9 [Ochotona princeps]|uniref:inactive ribonuclease-like protein 9 n=1 Tax=Ochotona princeps TaxID=9978 RepID=UPI0027148B26|nr:inactive ribonuclease-like protein 9 [Ochotona princeps]
MLRILISIHPLSLLLLQLAQPSQPEERSHYHVEPDEMYNYDEAVEEFFGNGPTRPPIREKFIRTFLIGSERPLYDSLFCTDSILLKNVHHKSRCMAEHYFILMPYNEVKKICYTRFVECKDGIKKCNRSRVPIEGVYCKLTEGTNMPECQYDSFYKKGLAVIICKWANAFEELIPVTVNDIKELQ